MSLALFGSIAATAPMVYAVPMANPEPGYWSWGWGDWRNKNGRYSCTTVVRPQPTPQPQPEQPQPTPQPQPEEPQPEEPQPEEPQPEQPGPEQPQPTPQPQPEQPKPEQPKPEQPKPDQPSTGKGPAPIPGASWQAFRKKIVPEGSVGTNPNSIPASDPLAQLILNRHNDWRAAFGRKPLSWDQKLADAAVSNSKRCQFRHFMGEWRGLVYGECIMGWLGENMPMNVEASVDFWMAEGRHFDFNRQQSKGPETGHFEIVVNNGFTHVGCGWHADCGNPGGLYCEYSFGGAGNGGPDVPIPNAPIDWNQYQYAWL